MGWRGWGVCGKGGIQWVEVKDIDKPPTVQNESSNPMSAEVRLGTLSLRVFLPVGTLSWVARTLAPQVSVLTFVYLCHSSAVPGPTAPNPSAAPFLPSLGIFCDPGVSGKALSLSQELNGLFSREMPPPPPPEHCSPSSLVPMGPVLPSATPLHPTSGRAALLLITMELC